MKTLKLSRDSFDQDNTFTVMTEDHKGRVVRLTASLKRDYEKKGDGIYWALNSGSCLKSHYTEKDEEERKRLNSEQFTIKHGELVEIDGEVYKTRVLGKYSNCAIFDKV